MKRLKKAVMLAASMGMLVGVLHAPSVAALEVSREGNFCTVTSDAKDRERVNLIAGEKYETFRESVGKQFVGYEEEIDWLLDLYMKPVEEITSEESRTEDEFIHLIAGDEFSIHDLRTHLMGVAQFRPDGYLVEKLLKSETDYWEVFQYRITDVETQVPTTYEEYLALLGHYPDEIGSHIWLAQYLYLQAELYNEYYLGNLDAYRECVGTQPEEPGPPPVVGGNGSSFAGSSR